jgi:hypothetical protein
MLDWITGEKISILPAAAFLNIWQSMYPLVSEPKFTHHLLIESNFRFAKCVSELNVYITRYKTSSLKGFIYFTHRFCCKSEISEDKFRLL